MLSSLQDLSTRSFQRKDIHAVHKLIKDDMPPQERKRYIEQIMNLIINSILPAHHKNPIPLLESKAFPHGRVFYIGYSWTHYNADGSVNQVFDVVMGDGKTADEAYKYARVRFSKGRVKMNNQRRREKRTEMRKEKKALSQN